jgi:hypothetical protein
MARISTYPLAQPLDGTEEFISVQNSGSFKVTAEQLRIYTETGMLTGVVSKTLAPTGGDFATLNELFTWIAATLMSNAELHISVQPGIYGIVDAGTGAASYKLVASQLSKITFDGDDSATCYFNMGNSASGKSFITATNMTVVINNITFNNAGQIGAIATVDSSTIRMENVVAPQLDHVLTATDGSHILLTTCSFGCVTYGIKLTNSSDMLIDGAVIDGQGTAGVAVHGENNTSVVVRDGVTITNFGTGFLAQNTSKVSLSGPHTLTGNALDYSPPLNEFQGDGGYVTDGNMDVSDPTSKFEQLSNKNQPSGYAGLDSGGKVPVNLLPEGYGDEVQEFNEVLSFPATGVSATLYIAVDTGVLYRWGQVQTSPSTWTNQYINITDAGYF